MNFYSPGIVFWLKLEEKRKKNKTDKDLNPSLWIQSQSLYHCTNLTSLIRKVKYDSFILSFSYNLYLLKFHSLLHKKGSPLMLIEEIYNNFSIWISFRNENGRKKKNKSHWDLNPSLWISSQMLYHWAILTYLSNYLKLDTIEKPVCFRFFYSFRDWQNNSHLSKISIN